MTALRALASTVTLCFSALAVASPQAAAATVEDYSVTIKHNVELDEVVGTAKNVGGSWTLVLDWRSEKGDKWSSLAGTGPVKGKKKQRASNVVRGEDFDFTGQWRTCVIKGTERTCTKPINVD